MRRVALITGGSRGIGFGIARELAQNNFDLAINGTRSAAEVENALKELKGLRRRCDVLSGRHRFFRRIEQKSCAR